MRMPRNMRHRRGCGNGEAIAFHAPGIMLSACCFSGIGGIVDKKLLMACACALAGLGATQAAAKTNEPPNGSWHIVPVSVATPRSAEIGTEDTVLLTQPVIPEAVRTTAAAVSAGGIDLPAGSLLFRATVKTATLWCALEPVRQVPEKKQSLAGNFLMGHRMGPPAGTTICFGDADGDGRMDSAQTAHTASYPLPIIAHLDKPVPVAPFATAEGDPAAVTGWTVELSARMGGFKKDDQVLFSLLLHTPSGHSSLEGYRLVDPTSLHWVIYGNLATIVTKWNEATPAKLTLEPIDAHHIRVTVANAMEARGFTLGKLEVY